jgi:hypothetical protein
MFGIEGVPRATGARGSLVGGGDSGGRCSQPAVLREVEGAACRALAAQLVEAMEPSAAVSARGATAMI